ncbi:MAG: hypothetical protein ABSE62_13245 [Chthoniobacteraceae bacterium]|jgi:hypothetical protein
MNAILAITFIGRLLGDLDIPGNLDIVFLIAGIIQLAVLAFFFNMCGDVEKIRKAALDIQQNQLPTISAQLQSLENQLRQDAMERRIAAQVKGSSE